MTLENEVNYSQYQYSDSKFLKKMFNLLGEDNFKRMVEISNEYCVIDKYKVKECDSKCGQCFVNFIKYKDKLDLK